jgi:predicted secreted protein
MVAQKGKDLLLKIYSVAAYDTAAGFRSRSGHLQGCGFDALVRNAFFSDAILTGRSSFPISA